LIPLAIKGSTKTAMQTKQQGFDCLQVPRVFTAKSAHEQSFQTSSDRCIATRYSHAGCRLHHIVAISLSGRLRKNVVNRFPGALLPGGDLFLDDHVGSSGVVAKIAGIREAPKHVAVEKGIPPLLFPTTISSTFSSGLLRVLNQKQTIGSATKTGTTHRNEQQARAQKIEHHATIQLEPTAGRSYIRISPS
jgi:hypothetical protein